MEIVQAILFITAEPDLDEDGEPELGDDVMPHYSQRNLQLEPEWIRKLAVLGITDICYTPKDAGLILPLIAFEDPAPTSSTCSTSDLANVSAENLPLKPSSKNRCT